MQLHLHVNTERALDLVEAQKVISALSGGRVESVVVTGDAPAAETAKSDAPATGGKGGKGGKKAVADQPPAQEPPTTTTAAPAPAPAAAPAPSADDFETQPDSPADVVTIDDVRAVIRTLMGADAVKYRDLISGELGKFQKADGSAVSLLPELQQKDYRAARDAISALGKVA